MFQQPTTKTQTSAERNTKKHDNKNTTTTRSQANYEHKTNDEKDKHTEWQHNCNNKAEQKQLNITKAAETMPMRPAELMQMFSSDIVFMKLLCKAAEIIPNQ